MLCGPAPSQAPSQSVVSGSGRQNFHFFSRVLDDIGMMSETLTRSNYCLEIHDQDGFGGQQHDVCALPLSTTMFDLFHLVHPVCVVPEIVPNMASTQSCLVYSVQGAYILPTPWGRNSVSFSRKSKVCG